MPLVKKVSIFAVALLTVICGCKKESSKPFHGIEGTYPCHGTIQYHDMFKTPVDTFVNIIDTLYISAVDNQTIKCTSHYAGANAVFIKDDGEKISFGFEEHHVSYYSFYIEYNYSTRAIHCGSTTASSAAFISQKYTGIDLVNP